MMTALSSSPEDDPWLVRDGKHGRRTSGPGLEVAVENPLLDALGDRRSVPGRRRR